MSNKEIVYPVLMQSLSCNQVVKFDSLNRGTVVIKGGCMSSDNVGSSSTCYIDCTDKEVWKPYISPSILMSYTNNHDVLNQLEQQKQIVDSIKTDIKLFQSQLSIEQQKYLDLKQSLIDNI